MVVAVADEPRLRRAYPETSKRVSINQREKIKKKVRDARKKKGKEAKKNVQWKSSMCFLLSVLGFIRVSASLRDGREEGKGRAEMK